MSKRRGAIGPNYSNFVLGVDQAMATFGSLAAIKDEYTRFRDMMNKRIERAVNSGAYLGDTALGQYKEYVRPATDRQGNVIPGKWKGNLPKVKSFKSTGEMVNFLGRLQRSTFRETGSLTGIREVRTKQQEEFDKFLQSYQQEEGVMFSNEDLSDIGAAMDYARSLGIAGLHYYVAATAQASDGDDGRPDKKELIARALMGMRERAKSPVQKGAMTRLRNALNSGDDDEVKSAITRLNNALRKYGAV